MISTMFLSQVGVENSGYQIDLNFFFQRLRFRVFAEFATKISVNFWTVSTCQIRVLSSPTMPKFCGSLYSQYSAPHAFITTLHGYSYVRDK